MKKPFFRILFALATVFLLGGISPGYGLDILMLKAGASHTTALRSDGTVWTWGRNSNGQLGDGSGTNRNIPTRVAMLREIVSIAVGDYHTLAIKADGTLWAWGWNGYGQLGDGTTIDKPTPVRIMDPANPTQPFGWNHGGVIEAAASYRHTLARMVDGTVWAWGYNFSGQLGDDTFERKITPVQVKTASGFLTDVMALSASDTYQGYGHSMALKADKTVWTWGTHDYSAIGRPISGTGATRQQVAAPVPGLSNVASIATGLTFCLARTEGGAVYGWGRNLNGQLGDGTTTTRETPTLVPGLSTVAAIAANNSHSVAVKQDQSIWAWGYNNGGVHCDGTTADRLSPVRMRDPADGSGFLGGADEPVSGWDHNLVLKQDGSIWGCGWNYYGQLGTGAFSGGSEAISAPLQTKFPLPSLVYVYGLNFISPGEEGTFLIEYENVFDFTLENAVVVFDLPAAFTYISSTNGAIYRSDDKNQVFWKLGNLSPGAKGQLFVKLNVPWGLPLHSKVDLMVNMGAVNHPGNLNVNEYLNYGADPLLQQKALTSQEIAALRSQDQALNNLLNQALTLGFQFFNVGQRVTYTDGTTFVRLVLFDFSDFAPVFLYSSGGRAHIEKVQKDKYTLFDLNGGMTLNRNDGSVIPWGTWAESHSLSFFQCMVNCAVEGLPNYLLGKYIKVIEVAGDTLDCVSCARTRDPDVCAKCAGTLNEEGWGKLKEYVDAFKCVNDCYDDPDSHICTKDKKECDPNGLWRSISMTLFEEDVVYITRCNTTLGGIYGATIAIQCAIGEVCSNGNCVDSGAACAPPSCAKKEAEITTAGDPNIKSADLKGGVRPGERINYIIECENVGPGTAYGVFILDVLDPALDEATRDIKDGGSYLPNGRLLSWDVGTLAPYPGPGNKKTVSFSVQVKADAAVGTQITNRAEVYFPSSNEITPTNPIVHLVSTLAADPQSLVTTTGTVTPIALTGRGPGSLSYRVTSAPHYGTLTGSPPALTYRSMNEFIGQDRLVFVVSSGGAESSPATVTIQVNPNPADTQAPIVISTYPAGGAVNVPVPATPVAQNPNRYLPALTAVFSEALDPATVNTTTVKVNGVTGAVSYDELGKTIMFQPLSPLASSTTYTVQLTSGIRDRRGNALAPYSWQFSSGSPANIGVTLPPGAQELNFGNMTVNAVSPAKTVSVMSTGTLNLQVGTVSLTGTQGANFIILEDQCSGKTLVPNQNCAVRLAFQPLSLGQKNGTLAIPPKDPDLATANVTLKGQGIGSSLPPVLWLPLILRP